jgi:hypothetical protein
VVPPTWSITGRQNNQGNQPIVIGEKNHPADYVVRVEMTFETVKDGTTYYRFDMQTENNDGKKVTGPEKHIDTYPVLY